ncbi:MAG: glycoside hydrolase family 2 TIM barrel-domain containing protein [Clostridia bacterium]|nr:glycoside hydrolase family 2 TIM barrel-domain containing protein [Clostridia bacterium]
MTRKKIYLNGEWDFMPIYENKFSCELPEKLVYEKEKCIVPSSWRGHVKGLYLDKYNFDPMNVFDYPKEWSDAEAGILHRTFRVPKEMKGQRIFLGFDAIAHKSAVYLNGEKLTEWLEAFLPLYIDITDKVKEDEENDLYVACCEFDECEIPSGQKKSTGLVGSWFGKAARGIWQDAYLYTKPYINISDVEIATSVRNKKISVYVDVANTTSCDENIKINVNIKDGDNVVKTMEETAFADKNADASIVISQEWANPVYWDTENPHLYNMEISLISNNKVIDTLCQRFGFREFWAEGQNFILNGTRVNLRGDSWHFQGAGQQTKEYALNWCQMCKENGVNSIRYHAEPHPEYYLDAADETGILIVDETAIYGSGKSMDASNPSYLKNCADHIRHFVHRDKNHASVVIWSLQNEMRWVDGRDEYKKHVPELMDIFHKCDRSGRLISLDGDNRLIDKEHTEIASLHYNIDGMVNQWDRKTPLTIGEHGGLWYICPQNSSMYLGLKTYTDSEYCAEGIALKEQLFMEYARKENVSGISSFNFAHYFEKSMPEKDIELKWDSLEGLGVKPRRIPQYSLTINNGNLPENYPKYVPNPTFKYAKEGMRAVTVFCDEYNHSFYDDKEIIRHLYVFNDTLSAKNVKLVIKAVENGKNIFEKTEEFIQAPGQYEIREVIFTPEKVSGKTPLKFTCELYHDNVLMFTMNKDYSIYPTALKTDKVTDKRVALYGSDKDFNIISRFAPDCQKVDLTTDTKIDADILIIGAYIKDEEKTLQKGISQFINKGGNIIILEQFGYSFGTMRLNKKDFLRAHASDYSHPVLKGLSDNDLIYWHEKAYEYGPVPFIEAAFEKPVEGNYNMLLECSFGDFGDDGDLWSPLLEYKNKSGIIIANQLQITDNINNVPQAALLLRNMLEYASEKKVKTINTSAIVNDTDKELLENIKLDCKYCNTPSEICGELLVISADKLQDVAYDIRKKTENGLKVLVMPSENKDEKGLSVLFGEKVEITPEYSYILTVDYTDRYVKGLSVVDLFGFDKPNISQRVVTNEKLALNSIDSKDSKILMASVEGTIWEDKFVNQYSAEFELRAIVEYNHINKKESRPYMISKEIGRGEAIAVQFKNDAQYAKSLRVYTRIFDNLCATFKDDAVDIIKGDTENALEVIMALPYMPYQDFQRAFEYYSDPVFSLNNLGEGLYGWMKKTERDRKTGYLNIENSAGNTMFLTAFVHSLRNPSDLGDTKISEDYKVEIDSSRPYELYINGERITSENIRLKEGINRLFILSKATPDDLKIRVLFKNPDNSFAGNLKYRLTTDEVDPK